MHREQKYDFRKKLLKVHESNIRNFDKVCETDKYSIDSSVTISYYESAGEVTVTSAEDFADFLKKSMCIKEVKVTKGINCGDIILHSPEESTAEILGEANRYRGFVIKTDAKTDIYAHDERGLAQALYYLEDIMTFEKAPFIPKGNIVRYPAYSPQMVHSGYGQDDYPDEYLCRVAHEGRDAIILDVRDINETHGGYLDFNDLIKRASRYGIDVYAYSHMISDMHPDDDGAEEFYDNTYGKLFRECPGLKGVTLVGESVEFPSRDPHISPGRLNQTAVDGIPSGKLTAGWYPCYDYPEWLRMLQKVIYKYNDKADIVFWTYNWGFQSEDARVKLIESLPEGISLLATFEMFHTRKYGEYQAHCADYTLAFEGYGEYFRSEAEAASKRGIKLYAMTNTGGITWDFGSIPYQPMPYQWIKRYKAMAEAKDKWGLCGIMESHHYGFYPSFISKLSKWVFMQPQMSYEDVLKQVLTSEFGEDNFEHTDKALRLWSEAITHFTPTDADQYGAFRVGPSYPFCLDGNIPIPADADSVFGTSICAPFYSFWADERDSSLSLRIDDEIKSLEKMKRLLLEGIDTLKSAPDKNEKLKGLINLGEFIYRTTITGINAKKWYVLKCKMYAEADKERLSQIIDSMEKLLCEETENTKLTFDCVESDSRLGWEPSMRYVADKWHLEWKIKQVEYVLNHRIPVLKQCMDN